MKRCPQCNRVEADGALSFCRVDGTSLVEDSRGDAETIRLDSTSLEHATSIIPHTTDAATPSASGPTTVLVTQRQPASTNKPKQRRLTIAIVVTTLLAGLSVVIYTRFTKQPNASIESIAVL